MLDLERKGLLNRTHLSGRTLVLRIERTHLELFVSVILIVAKFALRGLPRLFGGYFKPFLK